MPLHDPMIRVVLPRKMNRGRMGKGTKMADKKNMITATGAKKLNDELHRRTVILRKEIADKIKDAKSQGDISENAEYDAAIQESSENELRIAEIERILANAEIVSEDVDTSEVFVGAVVRLLDVDEEDEFEVTIVGTNESDSRKNMISNESPMGQALMNAKVGDTVTVQAPAGVFSYKILEIRKKEEEE